MGNLGDTGTEPSNDYMRPFLIRKRGPGSEPWRLICQVCFEWGQDSYRWHLTTQAEAIEIAERHAVMVSHEWALYRLKIAESTHEERS